MLALLRFPSAARLLLSSGSSKPLRKAHARASSRSSPRSPARPAPLRRLRSTCRGRALVSAAAGRERGSTAVEAEIVGDVEEEMMGGGKGDEEEEEEEEEGGEFSYPGGFGGRGEEADYDRDPEFAEILGNCFEDPKKAQARVEERIRKKRNKILQAKTGSEKPMKVIFNKFDFSNSYIWLELYNAPLASDISVICNTIRSWHIIGRLGGCNSMNMQLSQLPLDHKRPTYDAIQGANATPTTFYNIGDLEIQDNLARIWVDIGTTEPLLLDVLINALTSISSDYIGIKQVVFGGSKFENWKENLTSEETGCSIHKI